MNEFLRVLFDPGDKTCYGSTVKEVMAKYVAGLFDVQPPPVYFAINSLKGKRKDDSVATHRTFLIEIDDMPIVDQGRHIASIGMPYSACTYSGNKSLHYLITTEEKLAKEVWDMTMSRLLLAVPEADCLCKNPSRFSRFPGAFRADTQREQKLLKLKGRVAFSELDSWLNSREATTDRSKALTASYLKPDLIGFDAYDLDVSPVLIECSLSMISGWSRLFLDGRVKVGNRHRSLFLTSCNFCECKVPLEVAEAMILPAALAIGCKEDLPAKARERVIRETIRDGYKTVLKGR